MPRCLVVLSHWPFMYDSLDRSTSFGRAAPVQLAARDWRRAALRHAPCQHAANGCMACLRRPCSREQGPLHTFVGAPIVASGRCTVARTRARACVLLHKLGGLRG